MNERISSSVPAISVGLIWSNLLRFQIPAYIISNWPDLAKTVLETKSCYNSDKCLHLTYREDAQLQNTYRVSQKNGDVGSKPIKSL